MQRRKIKTGAPMPKKENDIANNPMKLYSYLVCIAGLADYPENTRMFRQKNLVLTKIKNAIGITDKTIKKYFYQLEKQGLIKYQGKYQFDYLFQNDYDSIKDYSLAIYKHTAEIWKLRSKEEKNGVYLIPRPNPYTPVPEDTLEKLNRDFSITELEMKIYLLCCSYRDTCAYKGFNYQPITFEQIRDVFNLVQESETNNNIRRALYLFKGLGLIDFIEGSYANSKGAKIPCFKLIEVNYYINYSIESFSSSISDSLLKEVSDRIKLVKDKIEDDGRKN